MDTTTEIDHLAGLTDAQREAVEHRDGAALVIAGPGSGKTRVITRRIVHLLKSGVKSSRILALTFTNKAASEMRERVEAMYPESKVWLGTFHSFASRVLRRNCQELNLSKDFHICDEEDRKKLIRDCMTALGVDTREGVLGEVSDAISSAKNALIAPGRHVMDSPTRNAVVAMVYQRYNWALRQSGRLDFDDLLNLLADTLRQNESLRAKLDDTFRYVLTDESQDTNCPQYLILRLLTRDTANVMAVADPDQLIYGWRGADIRNVMGFADDYPGCKVIKLEHNYRSTPQILRAADSLICHNRERVEKVLIPTRDDGQAVELRGHYATNVEAKEIAEDIERSVGVGRKYADHAILVRVHRLTHEIEQALIRRNIPHKIYGGLGFLGRKEVKDVLAYCRLATCPTDPIAFARVVNEPNRGVGKVTLDRLLDWSSERMESPVSACRQAGRIEGVSRKAVELLAKFADTLGELAAVANSPGEMVRAAAVRTGYRESIAAEATEEAAERVATIDQLCDLAAQYAEDHPEGTLAEFLERMTLGEEEEDGEEQEADRVKIMTIHGSKGLEFPVVYLPGLETGILPGTRAMASGDGADIEEERRCLFVGITRAMDRLVLSACKFRLGRDKMEYSPPSRFLDELPTDEFAVDWYK